MLQLTCAELVNALGRLAIFSFRRHIPQLKIDIFFKATSDQQSWELLTQANLTYRGGMAVHQDVLDWTEFKLTLVVGSLEYFDLAVIKARCSDDKSHWKSFCFANFHCLADLSRRFKLTERSGCHFDAAFELVRPRNDTWLLLAILFDRIDSDLTPCLTSKGKQAILGIQELYINQR